MYNILYINDLYYISNKKGGIYINIEILNNLLKVLKKQEKEIVLLGHDVIDCDSAISIQLFSRLLDFFKIKNRIVILDEKISDIDLDIMEGVGIDLNKFKGKISPNEPVFLLDHYKTIHGINVIGCIDHHPNLEKIEYPFYLNISSSSTAKIIFDFFVLSGYPVTISEVELVVLSIMIDTSSLKSTKCPEDHKIWTKEIITKYNLDYAKYYNIGLCLSNLNKPISYLVQEGLKKYCFNGIKVKSSYIQINRKIDENIFTNFIQKNLINKDAHLWVFLVNNFNPEMTTEYRITKNHIISKVYPQITSRGTTIIPAIEKCIRDKLY